QLARIGAQALLDGPAEGQDGGDRSDAQRQAGQEQAEAAEAAAHLAPRQSDRQAQGGDGHRAAAVALTARPLACGMRSSPTTSPSARRRMRSQRPASAMSWVIRI